MREYRLVDAIKTLLKFFHTTYEELITTSYRKEFISEISPWGKYPAVIKRRSDIPGISETLKRIHEIPKG
jgi:hypothetical protein